VSIREIVPVSRLATNIRLPPSTDTSASGRRKLTCSCRGGAFPAQATVPSNQQTVAKLIRLMPSYLPFDCFLPALGAHDQF
jgi:hypothetical protein